MCTVGSSSSAMTTVSPASANEVIVVCRLAHGALLFSSEALFFRIVGPVNFHARFSRKPASILGSGGFPVKFLWAFFVFALYFALIPI